MNREELLNTILNYFKQKGILSDFEKDILSTLEKYTEMPFQRQSAEQKVMENNYKYPEIFAVITALPGIQNKPFVELTENEVKHSLYLQIEAMWVKNLQEQNMKISNSKK